MRLVVLNGESEGAIFPLAEGRRTIIGRLRDNDIYLDDVTLARRHCCVEAVGNAVRIESFNGPSGVRVNGEQVEVGTVREGVRPGDVIQVGRLQLRLERGEAMTEARWLACDNPDEMLAFLRARMSERQLRLFACACCRRIWDRLPDDRCRRAVEVLERCADGAGTDQEVQEVIADAEEVERGAVGLARAGARAVATAWSTAEHARSAAARAAVEPAQERVQQARLLRDLVGNPFRGIAVDPQWLDWNDACVPRIARTISDEGRFSNLSILADALEESGCTDIEMLTHCRSEGPHVRGCWIIDLLLGKE